MTATRAELFALLQQRSAELTRAWTAFSAALLAYTQTCEAERAPTRLHVADPDEADDDERLRACR